MNGKNKIGYVTHEKMSKKEAFIEEAEKDFQFKSYYDRNIEMYNVIKNAVWGLSGVSMIAGLTACFVFFMMLFGINDTLLGFIQNKPFIAALAVLFSGGILFFIEKGKHNWYKDGLTEKKRQTDDNGAAEIRGAVILQIVSVIICVYGAYAISNEVAGTKAAKELAAIDAKYDAEFATYDKEISKADSNQTVFYNAALYRGKISDENRKEYNRLGQVTEDWKSKKEIVKANKEAEILAAGLGEIRYNLTDAKATNIIIYVMCGIQVAVEIALWLSFRWMVNFRYRVRKEKELENKSTSPTPSTKPYSIPNNTNPMLNTHTHTASTRTSITPIHERIKKPLTVVTQQTQGNTDTQTQHKVVDYTANKRYLKTYYNRIKKDGYSDARFKGIQRYAGALIEAGYHIDLGLNKKQTETIIIVDDKENPTLQNNEPYEITYDGQIRFVYPRLISEFLNKS